MTQQKLKPCPFCGGKAAHGHFPPDSEVNGYNFRSFVKCLDCRADYVVGSNSDKNGWCNESEPDAEQRAITAWNTRDTGQSDRMAALLRKWADTEGPGNSIALWAERDAILKEING